MYAVESRILIKNLTFKHKYDQTTALLHMTRNKIDENSTKNMKKSTEYEETKPC